MNELLNPFRSSMSTYFIGFFFHSFPSQRAIPSPLRGTTEAKIIKSFRSERPGIRTTFSAFLFVSAREKIILKQAFSPLSVTDNKKDDGMLVVSLSRVYPLINRGRHLISCVFSLVKQGLYYKNEKKTVYQIVV